MTGRLRIATRAVLSGTAFVLLLGAGPPQPKSSTGETYEAEDLEAPAPGPRWVLHTSIPGAPNLRAAFVYPRESGGGKSKADPSTLISLGVDPAPFTTDPEAFVKKGFELLSDPPLSFKIGKKSALKLKGGAPAFRIEYTDRDAMRHFTQVAILTPRGSMLVVTLQTANAGNFADDLPAFLKFVDTIKLKAPSAGTTGAPAPRPKPKP